MERTQGENASGARISGFKKVEKPQKMTVIGKSILNTDETKKRWVNKKLVRRGFCWHRCLCVKACVENA